MTVGGDPGPERRGTADVLSELRVTVGRIETTVGAQTKTLDRLESKLDVAILRDEFNAYKDTTARERAELTKKVAALADAHQQQIGSSNVWRLVFSGALAILTLVVAATGVIVAAASGTIAIGGHH